RELLMLEPGDGELTPQQVAELHAAGGIQLVDIREPWEHQLASIPDTENIPHGSLVDRLDALTTDKPVVLYCHTRGRSGQALRYLRARGWDDLHHLTGGIDAYSVDVDPSVPRY